jgi:hypothetical protein
MRDGKFFDLQNGAITDAAPDPEQPFPIRCGPWPNSNEGAIQRMCSSCGDSVGLSPQGIALHEAAPELRPLLCIHCCFLFMLTFKMEMKNGH